MNGGSKRWLWLLIGAITVTLAVIFTVWLWPKGPTSTPQDGSSNASNPQQSGSESSKPLEVSIDNLTEGQTVTGDVEITLNVDDISRVVRAEYFVDGVLAGVTYAYPFSYTLDTSSLSEGEHTVTAKAYDRNGTSFNADPVKITVARAAATDTSSSGTAATGGSSSTSSSSSSGNSSDSGGNGGSGDSGNQSDTTAPTAPSNLVLSADDGYTAELSWSASTDNVGINGYQVYRDGAALGSLLAAGTTSYLDQTVVPGNTYEYTVKAVDTADNYSPASNDPDITLVPTSIWLDADTPTIAADTESYEMGVKFQPLVDGYITGVKFYKGAENTGQHVGKLWESDGTELGSVTFTNETSSGWQQAVFDQPIEVTANTTYVVSYSVPNGRYAATSGYFLDAGITSQYLKALQSGEDGSNGVFNETPGSFPSTSFQNANYWVDALFAPNPDAGGPTPKALDNSAVYPGFPGSNNTGVPVGKRLPTRDRGIQLRQSGVVLENVEITGQVDIMADNVIIKNSKVNGLIYLDTDVPESSGWDFTVSDADVNAGTNGRAGISLGNFTLERVNMYGGIAGVLCVGNCTVEDSWFHGQYMPDDEDWHVNGFISNGGSNMVIRGSTVSCDIANNQAGGGCSGDLSLFGDFAAIRNVLIEDNYFTANDGATYCLNLGYNAGKPFGNDTENVDVINNIFEKGASGHCGSAAVATDYMISGVPAPGNSWVNNRWKEDDTVIPAPQ